MDPVNLYMVVKEVIKIKTNVIIFRDVVDIVNVTVLLNVQDYLD